MTTTRGNIHQALLTEMRKFVPNRYRTRKFKKMLRAYDMGFRDGTERQWFPDFDGVHVSRMEQGRATAVEISFGNLDYKEWEE